MLFITINSMLKRSELPFQQFRRSLNKLNKLNKLKFENNLTGTNFFVQSIVYTIVGSKNQQRVFF